MYDLTGGEALLEGLLRLSPEGGQAPERGLDLLHAAVAAFGGAA